MSFTCKTTSLHPKTWNYSLILSLNFKCNDKFGEIQQKSWRNFVEYQGSIQNLGKKILYELLKTIESFAKYKIMQEF